MAKHFASKNLPVPEVYAHSDDRMAYVQQDLGDTLLFNAIEKGRKTTVFSEEEKALLSKTIRQLPDIQFAGATVLISRNATLRRSSRPLDNVGL